LVKENNEEVGRELPRAMMLDFFRNDLLELFPGWLSELKDILYFMFINEYNGVKLVIG